MDRDNINIICVANSIQMLSDVILVDKIIWWINTIVFPVCLFIWAFVDTFLVSGANLGVVKVVISQWWFILWKHIFLVYLLFLIFLIHDEDISQGEVVSPSSTTVYYAAWYRNHPHHSEEVCSVNNCFLDNTIKLYNSSSSNNNPLFKG